MLRFHPGTRALRWGRASLTGQIYHVTTATRNREPHFIDWPAGRCVVHALRAAERVNATRTLAFCLMPDHLHWLLQLGNEPLSRVVGTMKGRAARAFCQANPGTSHLWQRGFYDHALRAEEDLVDVARYIIANPLRAGLVKRVGDYPLWDCVWL